MAAIGFSLLGLPILFNGRGGGGLHPYATAQAAVCLHPHSIILSDHGDLLRCFILLVFGTVVLMVIPENVIRPHLALISSRIHPVPTARYTAPVFVIGIIGVIVVLLSMASCLQSTGRSIKTKSVELKICLKPLVAQISIFFPSSELAGAD